jgi:hypothetical protein
MCTSYPVCWQINLSETPIQIPRCKLEHQPIQKAGSSHPVGPDSGLKVECLNNTLSASWMQFYIAHKGLI